MDVGGRPGAGIRQTRKAGRDRTAGSYTARFSEDSLRSDLLSGVYLRHARRQRQGIFRARKIGCRKGLLSRPDGSRSVDGPFARRSAFQESAEEDESARVVFGVRRPGAAFRFWIDPLSLKSDKVERKHFPGQ